MWRLLITNFSWFCCCPFSLCRPVSFACSVTRSFISAYWERFIRVSMWSVVVECVCICWLFLCVWGLCEHTVLDHDQCDTENTEWLNGCNEVCKRARVCEANERHTHRAHNERRTEPKDNRIRHTNYDNKNKSDISETICCMVDGSLSVCFVFDSIQCVMCMLNRRPQ